MMRTREKVDSVVWGWCVPCCLGKFFLLAREARWLNQLRNDVNGNGSGDHATPSICCDNQGALGIVSIGAIKQYAKNIDVC